VPPDDERLSPVFATAGAQGLPALIHTADPVAFFTPWTSTTSGSTSWASSPRGGAAATARPRSIS
jgi:hypothetical protein